LKASREETTPYCCCSAAVRGGAGGARGDNSSSGSAQRSADEDLRRAVPETQCLEGGKAREEGAPAAVRDRRATTAIRFCPVLDEELLNGRSAERNAEFLEPVEE
jgi:hypothetical protein